MIFRRARTLKWKEFVYLALSPRREVSGGIPEGPLCLCGEFAFAYNGVGSGCAFLAS